MGHAKDVILEMLRRHGVSGGVGRIIEYYGPGIDSLSAMDRHVIANMGAELGATTTVFPSDDITRKFLKRYNREKDWTELKADKGCEYDEHDSIDLAEVEPLIMPYKSRKCRYCSRSSRQKNLPSYDWFLCKSW